MSERNTRRETAVYQAALRLIARGASPAAMKVQDIAREAGIGKGTVYEYFSSKEEILRGMALYCFDTEIGCIRQRFAACATLTDLEDAVIAYLQDLAGSRMGPYKVIADNLGGTCLPAGAMERFEALRTLIRETMARLQAAGEVDPALAGDYCAGALLSAAVGGALSFCYLAELGQSAPALPQHLRTLIRRALAPAGKA